MKHQGKYLFVDELWEKMMKEMGNRIKLTGNTIISIYFVMYLQFDNKTF